METVERNNNSDSDEDEDVFNSNNNTSQQSVYLTPPPSSPNLALSLSPVVQAPAPLAEQDAALPVQADRGEGGDHVQGGADAVQQNAAPTQFFYETFYWFFSFTVHLFVSKT